MRTAPATILFACILLGGCIAPDVMDAEGPFQGLDRQLERNASRGRPLTVIVVHGIGPVSVGYSNFTTSELAQRLGLERTPSEGGSESPYGLMTVKTRIHRHPDGLEQAIEAKEFFWRTMTSPRRESTLAYDSDEHLVEDRASVNAFIKKEVMNDRFADSLAYLGPLGSEIRHAFKRSIAPILARPESDIAIISHSLGSSIVFDTLTEMAAKPGGIAPGTHITQYMLANQLPLLELAHRPFPDAIEPTSRLDVIAIGDPNDILTYTFSEDFKERHRVHGSLAIEFTNVRLTIAKDWSFGVLVNPMVAHMDYYVDERVLDLIAGGFGLDDESEIERE